MSEWWTYRPSDFLMFSPRTYWRLFELQNEAWWPAQVVLLFAGLAWLIWMAKTQSVLAWRAGAGALAVLWAFVGTTFVWQRYAPINWAANWFAAGLGGLVLALLLLATRRDLHVVRSARLRSAGLASIAMALFAYPLLGLVFNRWQQAEVFGMAPDPTAVATLGLLLCARSDQAATRWCRAVASSLTLSWCTISAATLWTMGSPTGWVPAAFALLFGWLWLAREAVDG